MAKSDQLNQLNLTVVALVALVAIVGLVALVLNAGSVAHIATGSQMASANNVAGQANSDGGYNVGDMDTGRNIAGYGYHDCAFNLNEGNVNSDSWHQCY